MTIAGYTERNSKDSFESTTKICRECDSLMEITHAGNVRTSYKCTKCGAIYDIVQN